MTANLPPIRGIADIEALERVPLESRNDVWTVYDVVMRGAAGNPEKAAFLCLQKGDPDETPEVITYRQLVDRMHKAANLFHSLGVGDGDSVAILLPIVPQCYFALLGAATAGIACPINWMLKPEQIASIMRAARTKVLVALGPTPGFDIWEKACALRELVPGLEHLLQVRAQGLEPGDAADFDTLCERQSGARLEFDRKCAPDDVALYVHTGGTTGMPKIARLVHRAIAYKCWVYSVILAQESSHTVFAGSPLFHIGGIVYHTMSALARGMTSVILGPMGFRTPGVIRNYWKLVERFRITDLFGVPTTLSALADVPRGDADVSSLRPYTMTGSAGLPVEISRYFERSFGVRILLNYGQTENTATISLAPRDGDPKFGSSGIRLPYTKVRTVILGEDGSIVRDCAVDEIGEIIVSGPGVIPGYLDESLNETLFLKNGWLRTGDLGRLDADSYLWVTGRVKDLIIRGGNNIDPLVIEQALLEHEAVALAAAVGRPDSYAGELPVAFVQLKPGACANGEELRDFARSRIPERAAVPAEVIVVDAMPLTEVGKIFKPELRNRAACKVFSDLVRSIAGVDADPEIKIAPHPVHGTFVNVMLSAREGKPDPDIDKRLRSAFGRFTYAHEIAWRNARVAPDASGQSTGS
jgi:fatty-acyl-CoA synthase